METVTAGDEVALQLLLAAVVPEVHGRPVAGQAVHADVGDLEPDVAAVGQPLRDQVLDDLLLAVHRDGPAGEVGHRHPVAGPFEAKLDALVAQALAVQPLRYARLAERVDRALLEHPGSHAALDVVPAAHLQHNRRDPVQMQQVRQQQAGGARADDSYLCPHESSMCDEPP